MSVRISTRSSKKPSHEDNSQQSRYDSRDSQDQYKEPIQQEKEKETSETEESYRHPNESHDSEIESEVKEATKKRRRDKNASSDILSVVGFERGSDEQYQGSDVIPEAKETKYQPKVKRNITKNDKNDTMTKEENVDENENEKTSDKVLTNGNDKEIEKHDTKTENSYAKSNPSAFTNGHSKNGDSFEYSSSNSLDKDLEESLKFLKNLPKDVGKITKSGFLGNLMDQYLNDKDQTPEATVSKPRKTSTDVEKLSDLEKNLKALRTKNKKQPLPPVRNKPLPISRTWEDPREHQRQKNKEKAWPPKEPPRDTGAYVVESYGQTDPYSKRLIKDIQKQKREEQEIKEAQKRAEIIKENTKPVSHLRSTFDSKPARPKLGMQRPEPHINKERSWIKHEKKAVEFDNPPDEPDWMKLIRTRRWKSTVKARFPCQEKDRTEFERRSTTPKNWKRLAKDKNALRMLSEIVGIGAEGEELFMRLASQRQKIEDEQEALDKLAEQELMAYEVAREQLGEDAAYQLQMDNPLPAARMKRIPSSTSARGPSLSEIPTEDLERASVSSGQYPFTTSQLEAAYLTNQLLRLHPEEFRKLMSLERSRQATLRWQFSADPFDSVHDHQSLPFEIALLASEEPRVQQAMKKILSQASTEDYRSVFSGRSTPGARSRTMTDGGRQSSCGAFDSDLDGYDSSQSSGGSSLSRGRTRKKKKPVPPPTKPRMRSVSPSMLSRRQDSSENYVNGPTLTVPRLSAETANKQLEDDREVHAHGLLTDEELKLSEEIAKLQELTSNIGRDIEGELKDIEASLDDDKKEYLQEILQKEKYITDNPKESIDLEEIAARRKQFMNKDLESQTESNVRDSLPKKRHKVRRIQSATQLDAVFRRRRKMSESNLEDDDSTSNNQNAETSNNRSNEMKDLIQDINKTYGDGNE